MIALVWFLISLVCVLVYIVMRLNWRINDLEDRLENAAREVVYLRSKALDDLTELSQDLGMYDQKLHDFNDSCDFEVKK
jgi:predicted Holliday junction resolvase-like endonuclease